VRSQSQLLALVSQGLTDAGVVHMVVGSLASSFHGEPRQTRDIDIVVEADLRGLVRFRERLDPGEFYSDAGAMHEAIERRTSFNVIDTQSAWKVDLLVQRDRPFSQAEMARRLAVSILDVDTFVASPEDTIIAKLEWGSDGGSERQLRDVVGILEAQGDGLDRAYVERWTSALGLRDMWQAALEMPRPG
jgi:hypothetical protein